jgi:hypothetical protein
MIKQGVVMTETEDTYGACWYICDTCKFALVANSENRRKSHCPSCKASIISWNEIDLAYDEWDDPLGDDDDFDYDDFVGKDEYMKEDV